jgi:hypothetical protein
VLPLELSLVLCFAPVIRAESQLVAAVVSRVPDGCCWNFDSMRDEGHQAVVLTTLACPTEPFVCLTKQPYGLQFNLNPSRMACAVVLLALPRTSSQTLIASTCSHGLPVDQPYSARFPPPRMLCGHICQLSSEQASQHEVSLAVQQVQT